MLYIVATPIGNLADITQRAISVLSKADVVLAEDTRVTAKLLSMHRVHTKLERCDENIIVRKTPSLIKRMQAGESFAFCSDAGMPGISDPGLVLVDAAYNAGIKVEVIPGPSALDTAFVSSGFISTSIYFGGFLPRKSSARRSTLQSLSSLEAALIFYESPHRVLSAVCDMADVFPSRRIALCRELTKIYEEVIRMNSVDLYNELSSRQSIKGECVLVVEPKQKKKRVHHQKYPKL